MYVPSILTLCEVPLTAAGMGGSTALVGGGGAMGPQPPKAATVRLKRPLLGCMYLRTCAVVGTVTILHLSISPVFVIQERFKIRRTYKFVLHMSQDCHLPCPAVSKAHRHQFLKERTGCSHGHIQSHLAQEELHLP